MQLNESRRPALFPSRKCYINERKIDKNTNPPKGTRSGKQLFYPYPSVFAESYVRCDTDVIFLQMLTQKYQHLIHVYSNLLMFSRYVKLRDLSQK